MAQQVEEPRSPSGPPSRWKERRPRVFLGPIEVAGYYRALEAGLLALGVPALAVDLSDHPFRYGSSAGRAPLVAQVALECRRRRVRAGRSAGLWKMAERFARLGLLLWSLPRIDVYVFGFGDSILRLHELGLLKLVRKRVVMVFHGSDLRPPYMDGPTMGTESGNSIEKCEALTARQKARAQRIERHADLIVSHPLYSHFLERPYIRALALGLPLSDISASDGPRVATSGRVRVLHAPSSPAAKGTPRVRAAIDALIAEGLPIDYVEVSGQPHAVVLRELETADLVVDQLYSDTPMAGLAAEAAGFGCPAIVGSCDWDEIRRVIPPADAGPVKACSPEDVAQAIREMVTDPDTRVALGNRARAFVLARSDPAEVAARLLRVIAGDAPPEWIDDPADTRHLCGAAMPSERVQSVVRDLVAQYGEQALRLDDKPELRASLIAWANQGPPMSSISEEVLS